MSELAGHIALVTGGGRGLGAATALALAESGADIAILSHEICELTAIVSLIRQKDRQVIGVSANLSDWNSVYDAIQEIIETIGPPDILVHTISMTSPFALIDDAHPQEWAHTVSVNLTGTFFCIHAVITHMLNIHWGRIITISSSLADHAKPSFSAYAVSHAGVVHLMHTLTAEMANTGVVSIIGNPGLAEILLPDTALPNTGPRPSSDEIMQATNIAAHAICKLCGPEGISYHGNVVNLTDPSLPSQT
jgi:NAD(P)-dependent dehydrogenase (short-subunit alcohol dehydrogenase family)